MDFGSLAAEQKIIVVILTLVVGGGYTIIRFMRPLLDSVTAKPSNTTTDTVVISAAFADGKAIRELNAHIERMNDCSERVCLALDAQSRASFSVAEGARQKIESDHRLASEIRMLTEALNRYGNRTNEPR